MIFKTNINNVVVIFLLVVILLLNIFSVFHKSETADEDTHYSYGKKVYTLNLDRSKLKYNSKMPISALNVIPRVIGKTVKSIFKHETKLVKYLYSLNAARLITTLFSLLLAFFIFKWTKELYGKNAGLFSLLLYTFSPNIIAHSRLVTTDLYAICFITISTYYFWKFIKFGGLKNGIISAFTLGLAQLPKYTGIYLYLIYGIILTIKYSGDLVRFSKISNVGNDINHSKYFFKYLVLFICINIIVINIGFFFNDTFTPLSDYKFRSELFKTIQSIPILKELPIPLPYPYVDGLDWVKRLERSGETHGNIYLFGKLQTKDEGFKGFKGYFFYAFFFKEPIAIQIFIIASLITYFINFGKNNFLNNELFLVVPVLFFSIYFNFLFRTQIGIRYFLVVLPFLYIFCGYLFKIWEFSSLKFKGFITFLSIYLIISVLSYFPHYLSYFNEIVWDRKQAYKILADSNIDWWQNKWYLEQYKRKNPNIIIHPKFPVPGKLVVTINNLLGIIEDPQIYKWLRENYEPIDHIGYSYLVFDVSPESLKDNLK